MESLIKTPKHYLFSNKALFVLFLPLLIEQGLEFFVGFADSVMVASLGEAAISGVSLVDFLMQLLIFGFSALATGGAVIAGQYLGNNKPEKARGACNQLVWFSGILSALLMVVVLIAKSFLINTLFGQIEADVWNYANTYLLFMAFSIPFIAIYNAGAAIYRTSGNSILPMKIMVICDILNVVGNAFGIYYLGLGVEGVAVPTVISRLIAAAAIMHFTLNENFKLHIKRTLKHKFDWKVLKNVLNVGIPYGIENGLFQFGRVLVLSLVSTFGTVAIAANSVGYAIGIFSVLPGFAINLGMTAVISRCVGANYYEQARYYNNLSPATAALSGKMIIWHGTLGILIWPIAFTLPNLFRGAGDAKWAMVVSLAVMFTCRIGLSYILAINFNMGVFGTWVAMFIDWFVRGGLYIYRYFSNKWTLYRVVES